MKPEFAQRWVCLQSEALSRLAAVDLLGKRDLSEEIREGLRKLGEDGQAMPLRIWVQLDGALWAVQSLQEKQRFEYAQRILVLRQANYALMYRLFRISRKQWLDVRRQFNAPAPPRSCKQLDDTSMDALCRVWSRLCKEYAAELDRWVLLSQEAQFRHIPMAGLYPLIYHQE